MRVSLAASSPECTVLLGFLYLMDRGKASYNVVQEGDRLRELLCLTF
jgi:hypothetical protein